jgi:hypothetical protein
LCTTMANIVNRGTCALCLKHGPIRDSHLIPKAAYRLIRKISGESPVIITKRLVGTTDLQLHHYLLCDQCELRFSGPERYALSQCYRGRRFRLQELLGTLDPLVRDADPMPYPTAGVLDIDVPSLVYFSSSLLWRASISIWRLWSQTLTLDLGPKYNEEFRRYLLGESEFSPNAAVWISVAKNVPHFVCVGPHLHNKTTYYQFEMQMFGIRWSMFVGRELDPIARRMCSLRSQERFIYLSDSPDALAVQGVANLVKTAHIAQNLQ